MGEKPDWELDGLEDNLTSFYREFRDEMIGGNLVVTRMNSYHSINNRVSICV